MSDFHTAGPLLSERFCPLCEEKLGYQEAHPTRCGRCRTDWMLTVVDGRPFIHSSRKLRESEIRLLFKRGLAQ